MERPRNGCRGPVSGVDGTAPAGAAAAVFMTPGEFRAQVTSLYVLTINGLGLLVGPTAVGLLNDHVFMGSEGVRYSLAAVGLLGSASLTLYFATGRRAYAESVTRLEAAQAARGSGS